MAPTVSPYTIAVPDSAIKTLKDKLALTRFPEEVDFQEDWDFGAPRSKIKHLAEYWRDGFDWRAQEARLNQLPQFQTTIPVDGFGEINIHFLHQKSSKPGSIPLLFCHGWPGSYLEALKILPLLTNPQTGPSFHVVAPSLPNFGWSDKVRHNGFSIPQYAEAMHKVMLTLGYDKYVTQGGDWGSIITRLIGILYPKHCLASHLNFVMAAGPPTFFSQPLEYLRHCFTSISEFVANGREHSAWFAKEGKGYSQVQGTKPSTIGFALADSPVGLLAWIYEKLHDWTDNYPWTDDEILTWISVYQFSTAGPAASVRIYYEYQHSGLEVIRKVSLYNPHVPLGFSYFPKELSIQPLSWGRTLGPVVLEGFHSVGGHFAAYERPEDLAGDVREMFAGGAAHVANIFAKL